MKCFVIALLVSVALAAEYPPKPAYPEPAAYPKPAYPEPAAYPKPAYPEPAYPKPAYPSYPKPEYPAPMPMPFQFDWAVKDQPSYNDYSHQSVSDGITENGSYRVVLPDGRTQIVTYKADENGYVAEVKYEGEAKYPAYQKPSYPAYPKPSYPEPAYPKPAYPQA